MITNKQVQECLIKIDHLIANKLGDDACSEYIKLNKKIENKENEIDNSMKANFYVSFAYFLFNVSEYEACINMLIKAQNYGYSKDKINEFIWKAFINPNVNEFRNIYQKNIELLISNKCIFEYINFKDLSYWLIPINYNKEYFIYNIKDKIIEEKMFFKDNFDINNHVNLPISNEFSDFLILDKWNFNNIKKCIYHIKEKGKKTYIVFSDIKKFFSCLQGILIDIKVNLSDMVIFNGFEDMKKYFQESNTYLPRNIVDINGLSSQAEKVVDDIHNYRIHKNYTKSDNILLSICIPSYNRGNRAYENVIHNLGFYYDNEIEIVLSNNGTQNETKGYYDKIRNIKDCRLNYFEFKENMGFTLNMCKVCELARGKFILLLSDEDLINFKALDKIMNIINNSEKKIAVLKTSGDVQGIVPSTKLAKPGEDAVMTYMLTSNYISGLIFNNDILKKYHGIEYIKKNLKNYTCDIYPHMFWELLLCQYGYVLGTNTVLIHEGKAEKSEFTKEKISDSNEIEIPHHATLEGRLEQHEGFLKIFRDLDICKNNFDIFRNMYLKLVNKTMLLVCISINVYYRKTDFDLLEILYKAYDFCIKSLEEVYSSKYKNYKKYYSNDLDVIKRTYNLFCQSLNKR
ncbi:glycosyltransferase [Clostridium kluyveri]|uniref:glycosyltransferase n=1 Tax=Clostridium kluyveri TaxID=1534 RepID=UPI002247154E|nr:glycosyltransferase [Clostridium kluyveri]UZQ50539.1 glycosyltransferase [Clostridium kluyveri]